jgi:two-component system NtrC family response regulator
LARYARKPVEQVANMLAPETLDALMDHEWRGNVRELANVMEHACIMASDCILPEHLPYTVREGVTQRATLPMPGVPSVSASSGEARARTLKEIEMEHLLRVLQKHGGNKAAAAEELGISLKTMYNKLNALAEERKSAG